MVFLKNINYNDLYFCLLWELSAEPSIYKRISNRHSYGLTIHSLAKAILKNYKSAS